MIAQICKTWMFVLATVTLSIPAFAATDPSATQAQVSEATQASLEGTLKCWYSKSGTVQMVELENATDGGEIKLVDYQDDLKAHCPPRGQKASAKVKVDGEMTPKFLLWGGNFRVKSFAVSQN